MTFDVYVLHVRCEELGGVFEERFSSRSEALDAVSYYTSTGIPVALYWEDSKTHYGELLMRSFGFDAEQEYCHE